MIYMKNQMAISEFKAHCLEVINKIHHTHESIIITKRDKPIAKVVALEGMKKVSLFGLLQNKAKIISDIVGPINENWSVE